MNVPIRNIDQLDATIEPMLRAARIPGAAIAVVAGVTTVFTRGYGYRDPDAKLAVASDTLYPIGSTTKAINATLLGMLADEGRLAWDAPVQNYLPRFRLHDPLASAQVTVRDLLAMRTGLPRHDFLWMENPIGRADIVECLVHLPLSTGLRERFQYSNLSATTAGYIAEILTGQSWEDLVRQRILEPLGMSSTGFAFPDTDNATLSYHENRRRELLSTPRFEAPAIAPAGSAIHSTVNDMTRWIAFNLNGGKVAGRQLIAPRTLQEIQAPCMVMGADPASPSPNAAYGLGWCVDTYSGRPCVSHAGYVHGVHSCVTLFPQDGLGIVSFVNFAGARLASLINQYAFDLIMGFAPVQTLDQALALYESKIESTRVRNASVTRVENTSPSHPLSDYVGNYLHAGYGRVEIRRCGQSLSLERNALVLPLEHWHYDAWVVAENDLFEIHKPHAFDRASRILFETNADGEVAAVSIRLEPAVAPARFELQKNACQ